jgi:DNA-binding transcriptional MerR regulator
MAADAPYPLRQALRLTGLSRRFLDSLVEQGLVGSPDGQRFSHQDVVVGRTAKALRDAGVPPRKVLQALRHVRDSLASGPLSGVRLRPHAGAVELHTGEQRLDAHTGQALLPFDDEPGAAGVQPLPAEPERDADHWLREAMRLEATDSAAAEAAYRRVLAQDVCCAAAYINLGALLCEARRCEEAVALYEQALRAHSTRALQPRDRAGGRRPPAPSRGGLRARTGAGPTSCRRPFQPRRAAGEAGRPPGFAASHECVSAGWGGVVNECQPGVGTLQAALREACLPPRPSRDFAPAADSLSCARRKVCKESAPAEPPACCAAGCPAMPEAQGSRRTHFATLRSNNCAKSVVEARCARALGFCASRRIRRGIPKQPTAKPESRSLRGIPLAPFSPAEERKVLRACAQRTSRTDSVRLFERSVAKRVPHGPSRPEYRRGPTRAAGRRGGRGELFGYFLADQKVTRPPGRNPGMSLATKANPQR